jgi:S-adenosylmethionine hydrolase
LITSLRASEVLPSTDAPFRVQIAGQRLRCVRTFADATPGELVALVGSFDAIEVVVRDGSALERLAPVGLAHGPEPIEKATSVKLFPS